jgi:hypothetical protein
MKTQRSSVGLVVTTPQQAPSRDSYSRSTFTVATFTRSIRVPSNTAPSAPDRVS